MSAFPCGNLPCTCGTCGYPPLTAGTATGGLYSPANLKQCIHGWIGAGCGHCERKIQDVDKEKSLKVFKFFAKKFCERYPNWTMTPEASNPFHSIVLENKTKMIRLINCYPMNELEITGLAYREYAALFNSGIKYPENPYSQMVVSMITFEYWALEIEEIPESLR